MAVTKRFIYCLIFGFLFILLGSFIGKAFVAFLFYNLLLVCLLILDYFLSPKKEVLEISRAEDEYLFLQAENRLAFTIRNNYHRPLLVEIKDGLPDRHFQVKQTDLKHTVLPNAEQAFYYDVIPTKRGSFEFQNIYIRFRSIWGLCTKYARIEDTKRYKIYPNLKNLNAYRLLVQNNHLLQQGERKVPLIGLGTEFKSLREYVLDDDYRKINWLVSARENKLIVNQYEVDKNQPVFILLDTGRSMSYSMDGYKKLDYAINAALILSDIVNQKGDKSGIMVFDTDVKAIIPTGKGEKHRNLLMDTLYTTTDTKNTSNYAHAFHELNRIQKRRSLVFVFTDFETLDEAHELVQSIRILSLRHIPLVILMKNNNIEELIASDDTPTGMYNKAVALDFLAERRKIIQFLSRSRVTCIESDSEKIALDAINQYIQIKNKNRL